jgi:DNA-binding MarR family transcriptional regulator
LLQSEREKQIFQAIEEQPGISFRALMRKTGIWQATLAPTLTYLEKQGYITEDRDGMYRRFKLTSKGYERLARLTAPNTDLLTFLKNTKEGRKLLTQMEQLTEKVKQQEKQIQHLEARVPVDYERKFEESIEILRAQLKRLKERLESIR